MFYECKSCGKSNLTIDIIYKYHNVYLCTDCNHRSCFNIDECCHEPFLVVRIETYSYERYSLYHQCINCGGANKSKHLKSKNYSEQIRSEFNQQSFIEWKLAKSDESNLIHEDIKKLNYRNTDRYKYHQYLDSIIWKNKRKIVLERDKYLCQICKILPAEDVHHLNYNNVYNEKLEDLQSLCKKCHNEIHILNPYLAQKPK